jgi:uncharacterized protein (DUF952 family)
MILAAEFMALGILTQIAGAAGGGRHILDRRLRAMNPDCVIYKIVSASEWVNAERAGVFGGSAVDRRDGFMHFSTAAQVRETAARHFPGTDDLRLVAVAVDALEIRWEPSRGGALFPHLYGPLPLSAVRAVHALQLDESGRHRFPAGLLPTGE